jgi:hypothetical protein
MRDPVHAGLTTEPLGRSRTFDDQVNDGSVDYRITPDVAPGGLFVALCAAVVFRSVGSGLDHVQ